MLLVFPILPPIHILGGRHPFQPNFSVPPIYLTVPINICNARVRTSGRASRVGRLSWRHTRRGATTTLSLSAPPHGRPLPLVFSPSIFCYFNIHPRGRRERLLLGAPTTACTRGWGEGGGLLARRWQLSALSRATGAAGSLLPPVRRAEPVVAVMGGSLLLALCI
jgi:hypothetical protein